MAVGRSYSNPRTGRFHHDAAEDRRCDASADAVTEHAINSGMDADAVFPHESGKTSGESVDEPTLDGVSVGGVIKSSTFPCPPGCSHDDDATEYGADDEGHDEPAIGMIHDEQVVDAGNSPEDIDNQGTILFQQGMLDVDSICPTDECENGDGGECHDDPGRERRESSAANEGNVV